MHGLIIDDEDNIRTTTAVALESMGHETHQAADGRSALKMIDDYQIDVAFLDLKLGAESGLELLPHILRRCPGLNVIVFTAYASIENAVEAIRGGATDYIPKPFTPEQIRQVLDKISRTRQLEGRVAELEDRLSVDSPRVDLTTVEPEIQKLLDLATKAAATPATILLTGESGTGKSVLARAVHEKSPQHNRAFVLVNCPSLSRELLESELFGHVTGAFTGAARETWGKVTAANGGTLFLDEIGEVPLEVQPKLLRLLQDKEYERVGESRTRRANVRLIAATNRDLEKAVQAGAFREDLFYRLNVITLHMPPLRERKGDLLRLASGYLDFFSAACGKKINSFSDSAATALTSYSWPGNLRELRNAIERAVILATNNHLNLEDLPDKVAHARNETAGSCARIGARVSIEELEAEHIRQVLRQTDTMEEAARVLGIDPATLYRKRKKLTL
jgi:NtrC-family two-component system response regulator AlgB